MLVDGGCGVGVMSSNPSPSPNGLSPKGNLNPPFTRKSQISNSKTLQDRSPVKASPLEKGRTVLELTTNEKDVVLLTTPPPLVDVEARLANTPPHVLIRSISSLSQQSIRPRTPDPEVRGLFLNFQSWIPQNVPFRDFDLGAGRFLWEFPSGASLFLETASEGRRHLLA